jgi:polysaccharide export outer membrane protein
MNKTTHASVSPTLCPSQGPARSQFPPPNSAAAQILALARRSVRTLASTVTLCAAASLLLVGCANSRPMNFAAAPALDPQTLRAGDVIKITFPRTPALDSTQQIRRDGMINLSVVGEVTAANLSPAALEKQLLDLYATELVAKEVRVTVVSSAFAVFVTGAVVHPGKLTPDRALTAFDAIMEAGGFDVAKADSKAVTIIRQENGQTKNFTVNLKAVLEGRDTQPFYLKAYDVIYVPEKFSWF